MSINDQHYCLRWNNYQTNMTSVFQQLLQNEAFVDVTLACNDLSLKAHKVVLSACSSYFRKLLLENPCHHPTIIMPQDVCYTDLKFIIDFVYKGEIDVSQAELQSLLKTAGQLKIKGLCDTPEEIRDNTAAASAIIEGWEFPKVRRVEASQPTTTTSKEKKNSECISKNLKTTKAASSSEFDKCCSSNSSSEESQNSSKCNEATPAINPAKSPDRNTQNMSSNGLSAGQMLFSQFGVDSDDFPPDPPAPAATPVGNVDMNEHSPTRILLTNSSVHRTDLSNSNIKYTEIKKEGGIKLETLRSYDQEDSLLDIDSHMSGHSMDSHDGYDQQGSTMMMMMPGVSSMDHFDQSNGHLDGKQIVGPKTWTQDDMERALDALRNHNMSLTKASATYGIPSTTLWQRAHRLGIDTPKKEGPTKSWTEENLNSALDALRTGTISANKASKAYGIPSSTLYKIARREGIRLAAPFNAAPTTWTPEDLEKALESIRSGQTSVQRASTEFGIPTGTLYGRCKREGIELSRSNPTPWSEGAMGEALEAVRLGHMSINQAAIHYNLPYSSLYGRFKRGAKYDAEHPEISLDSQSQHDGLIPIMEYSNSPLQYQTHS